METEDYLVKGNMHAVYYRLTLLSRCAIITSMIKSFKCKNTEKLFNGKFIKKLPQNLQRAALRKLKVLDAVTVIETLKVPPGNHFEALHGDREGQYRRCKLITCAF